MNEDGKFLHGTEKYYVLKSKNWIIEWGFTMVDVEFPIQRPHPQPPPEGKPPSPPLQPPVTLLIQLPTALPLLPPGNQAGEHHQCGWAGGAVKQYRSVTRTGRHHPLPVSPQVNQTRVLSLSLSHLYPPVHFFTKKYTVKNLVYWTLT